jgi:hypothetical protein
MFAKQAKLLRYPIQFPDQRIPTKEEKDRDASYLATAGSSPSEEQTARRADPELQEASRVTRPKTPQPSFVHNGVRYASYQEFKGVGMKLEKP